MLVGQAGGFLLPIATGFASQHGGFGAALALLAAVHAFIVVPGLRFSETGSKRAGAALPNARPA
jgi:hypothetical protein